MTSRAHLRQQQSKWRQNSSNMTTDSKAVHGNDATTDIDDKRTTVASDISYDASRPKRRSDSWSSAVSGHIVAVAGRKTSTAATRVDTSIAVAAATEDVAIARAGPRAESKNSQPSISQSAKDRNKTILWKAIRKELKRTMPKTHAHFDELMNKLFKAVYSLAKLMFDMHTTVIDPEELRNFAKAEVVSVLSKMNAK
jgi:hypothetical protein